MAKVSSPRGSALAGRVITHIHLDLPSLGSSKSPLHTRSLSLGSKSWQGGHFVSVLFALESSKGKPFLHHQPLFARGPAPQRGPGPPPLRHRSRQPWPGGRGPEELPWRPPQPAHRTGPSRLRPRSPCLAARRSQAPSGNTKLWDATDMGSGLYFPWLQAKGAGTAKC